MNRAKAERQKSIDVEAAREIRQEEETFQSKAIKLGCCFVGLQGSYVTWGFIQEKVMTQRYDTGMFPSTVFLVCANRTLALVVAGLLSLYKSNVLRQPGPRAPFYRFCPVRLATSCLVGPSTSASNMCLFQHKHYSNPVKSSR